MKIEKLQNFYDWGFQMFGLYENTQLIGYVSLSKKEDAVYELHNHAIGIIEESTILRKWYELNGFVHKGTQKFDHLPFTVRFMEWNHEL